MFCFRPRVLWVNGCWLWGLWRFGSHLRVADDDDWLVPKKINLSNCSSSQRERKIETVLGHQSDDAASASSAAAADDDNDDDART